MMDERVTPNIGHFMRFAMEEWPQCRVYWLVEQGFDAPRFCLGDETGSAIPQNWLKPDLVTVCISPDFVECDLLARLTKEVRDAAYWNASQLLPSPQESALHSPRQPRPVPSV